MFRDVVNNVHFLVEKKGAEVLVCNPARATYIFRAIVTPNLVSSRLD